MIKTHKSISALKVGLTYIGTVVGAGFATGQEIIQFFTRYGWIAYLTIIFATLMFIWLGTKTMLIAHRIRAVSYEDLNKYLFGSALGKWVSLFTLIVLFGITTVMLAGAGSLFSEHLHFPVQLSLLATLGVTYFILKKGIGAILTVNSIVAPVMILFSILILADTVASTHMIHGFPNLRHNVLNAWIAPLLYTSFNLSTAQAVLVPIGAQIQDRSVIYWGGWIGGMGIGLMLLIGHFALSVNLPDSLQYDIPMGHLVAHLGYGIQISFILVIFGEIFTTFISNIYGLTLQLQQRTSYSQRSIILFILGLSYLISQIGFRSLLSTLYPIFGMIGMAWLVLLMWKKEKKT